MHSLLFLYKKSIDFYSTNAFVWSFIFALHEINVYVDQTQIVFFKCFILNLFAE